MNTIKVNWKAAWYELDQSIKCGAKDEWWLMGESDGDARFYTAAFDDMTNIQKVYGEIVSIRHKSLGLIREIDCHGLTYKITLATDQYVVVEAEETPGRIENASSSFSHDFDTDEFRFEVEIKTE